MKTFLRIAALVLLSSVSAFAHQVTLSCIPSTSIVVGYNVYREAAGATAFIKITATPVTACGYIDTAVTGGTSYTYTMTSVDSAGVESIQSVPVTVTVPIAAPTGVRAISAELWEGL